MSASATIIPFPVDRTRPGIRDLVAHCQAVIETAVSCGEWKQGDADDMIGRVRKILPQGDEMARVDHAEMLEIGQTLSLAALYAIHTEVWEDGDIPLMLQLQAAATGQEASRSVG